MFEKWDDVENRPSCKGYSPCKGYSLCKMVSLGQKLKYIKTCEKHKHTRVVLWKNPLERNTKYSISERNVENRPSCKGYSPCKGYSLCKMVSLDQLLKCIKTCEKHILSTLELFCAKNRWKKHQIFEKWDDFENRPSCKGYSPCKGYRLCLSLDQLLKCLKTCKKHICKHTRVVLWKKPLEKSTRCSRNETMLKIPHLAKATTHAEAIASAKWSVWVTN